MCVCGGARVYVYMCIGIRVCTCVHVWVGFVLPFLRTGSHAAWPALLFAHEEPGKCASLLIGAPVM